MREIEIKLKVQNLDVIVSKLKELGCVISEPETQEDRNFIHKDDDKWFEPEIRGFAYPRLRIQNGDAFKFTLKKPLKNEMDYLENEVNVDSPRELEEIMKMMGYRRGVTVKKIRRTTKYRDYTITLDEVNKLGNFIEIEKVVENGDALKIQEEMFGFAKKNFGLERNDFVMKGYDIMMYHLENKQ